MVNDAGRTFRTRAAFAVVGAVGLILAVGAMLARPGRPAGGEDASTRARRERGLGLAKAGRGVEAEAILRTLLLGSQGPEPEVAEALAKIYLETYHLEAALAVAERWAKDAPADHRPWVIIADLHGRAGEPPSTLVADYEAALARDPNFPAARLGLADALRMSQRHAEAAEQYAAYLAVRPDDPAAHRGAGLVALAMNDDAKAAASLDRALALAPDDVLSLLERSGLDLRRGDLAPALAHLDRAAKADPFDPEVRYKRSLILARLSRPDEARAEAEATARLRADQARMKEVRKALVKNPGDRSLMLEAARWLSDHGHPTEGTQWAERVVRDHPGDPDACKLLAENYQKQGNVGLANFYRSQAR